MNLDEVYWSSRYASGKTGWDIGYPSPPITQYLDQLDNKSLKILLPGAGNAYEAAYAFQKGFQNLFILDIAKAPLEKFKKDNPLFPAKQLIRDDFFNHNETYDLVLEQTFFCALDPELRRGYVNKMHEIINPKGRLAGVLFNRKFDFQGPPFGGTKAEYQSYFSEKFDGLYAPCYNSIPERMGAELWINLRPK